MKGWIFPIVGNNLEPIKTIKYTEPFQTVPPKKYMNPLCQGFVGGPVHLIINPTKTYQVFFFKNFYNWTFVA